LVDVERVDDVLQFTLGGPEYSCAIQDLSDHIVVVLHKTHHFRRRRRVDDMLGDNARMPRTENEHIGSRGHPPLVVREHILDQEPIIEQEQERRQEGNENDRIRYEVMQNVVVVYQVDRTDQNKVEDHHIKDPHTVLNARIPDNAPTTVRDQYGKKATPELDAQRGYKVVCENVFNDKAETQEIANNG